MRILTKLGPYIFTIVVVGVVVFVATMFFTWSTGLNAPKTAVESPVPSPAATYSQPATTPEDAQVAAGTPPADEYTPPAPAEPAGSYFGGEDSMVAGVDVVDDDVIIALETHSQANATQTHAPYVLQEAIDNLTGSEHAPQIDLVAVFSEDGVMVASGRIPGGKYS